MLYESKKFRHLLVNQLKPITGKIKENQKGRIKSHSRRTTTNWMQQLESGSDVLQIMGP